MEKRQSHKYRLLSNEKNDVIFKIFDRCFKGTVVNQALQELKLIQGEQTKQRKDDFKV